MAHVLTSELPPTWVLMTPGRSPVCRLLNGPLKLLPSSRPPPYIAHRQAHQHARKGVHSTEYLTSLARGKSLDSM